MDDHPRPAATAPHRLELLKRMLREKGIGAAGAQTIPRRRLASPCPMSFAQQRLWFLEQTDPGGPLYNIPFMVRLQGVLDVDALGRALDEVVRRHESLRTTFAVAEGRPVQVINPPSGVAVRAADLCALPEPAREQEVRHIAREEMSRGFDLAAGPLMRVRLLRLGAQDSVLLAVLHHIIWDGWSLNVFIDEVAALYEAARRGATSPLPELTIQYADYAAWQRERLRGEALEKGLGYWKRQLGGVPLVQRLPADRPPPQTPSRRGAEEFIVLPTQLSEAVHELSRGEGVTPFMTLLAAFKALLYRHTAQEDIVVGAPVAGRDRPETEQLIGFFINTLVLRTRLDGNPTFRQLLRRVREVTLGAYAHGDVPFEKVVEELQPERGPHSTPLARVMIGLQHVRPQPPSLPGLRLSAVELENETARCDLYLSLTIAGPTLTATIAYSLDLFEASTIRRMLRHYAALLRHVVSRPEATLDELCEMLSANDRRERRDREREFEEGSLRGLKGIRRRAVNMS